MFDIDLSAAVPIRTPGEQQRFSAMTQARLHAEWGLKYEKNMRLIQAYIDKRLNPLQQQAMETAKNRDGFLIGSDIRYIMKLLELAKTELTSSECKAATKIGPFKGES